MKDNQHEQLFTELTPAEAAVVEGGATFVSSVDFDDIETSLRFNVRAGGTITLRSSTKNSRSIRRNPEFGAVIINLASGNKSSKVVKVGSNVTTKWTNVRGGDYVIEFRDTRDGVRVAGGITIVTS